MEQSVKNTQMERVLDYIGENGTITSGECLTLLGISDGRKIISELRRRGHNIGGRWETGKNRYGQDCRYKVYFMGSAS